MNTLRERLLGSVVLLALMAVLVVEKPVEGQEKGAGSAKAVGPRAWTLDEAMAQLWLYPRDSYLQYVALQLGRRQGDVESVAEEIDRLTASPFLGAGNERARRVDLFSIFSGALAVQESLQLDRMAGERARPGLPQPPGGPGKKTAKKQEAGRTPERVPVSQLAGPQIKSHPWEKMLGGKKPSISLLARCVPEDSYLVEFRSLTRLLDALDASDLWGSHLFSQAAQEARTQLVGERLKTQLAVETNKLLRPLYDLAVDSVAVTGSDLFVREGSDVTLLFHLRQPEVFKARMDGFLAHAEKARPDVKRSEGEYLGIAYVHLATPDRAVHVYSAYPKPDLHVRSNSLVGLRRVLEAIQGPEDKPPRRLGDTAEFAYIRTLFPAGAAEEDGLVYLSDPFIRRLVGAEVKLTERRRMLCYNHLRMIGHAALLYRTEHGRPAESLAALVQAGCAPKFGEGEFACPDGGSYSLAAGGMTGICSHHGRTEFLTPCREIPVREVSSEEAAEYRDFVQDYNQYWRTYFDPIALRLQITPRRYRLETIILPLIDNSIYTGLAHALGGEPEPLDALAVPRRNIFSLAVRLNKEALLREMGVIPDKPGPGRAAGSWRLPWLPAVDLDELNLPQLLSQGIGNQVGLHACDAPQLFDLNFLQLPAFVGRGISRLPWEALEIGFVVASLNSPVYLSWPVRDRKIVDDFLARLDALLARLSRRRDSLDRFLTVEQDFYHLRLDRDRAIRCYAVSIGPVKWRIFWGRVGDGLYLASKGFILEDLMAREAERAGAASASRGAAGPIGHGMVRLRPQNWNQVLADYRLAWAENNRIACLHNLGPLSSVARAIDVRSDNVERELHRLAETLHGVRFFCPEGGHYTLAADGKSVTCSVHGAARSSRQPPAPSGNSSSSRLFQEFTGLTTSLNFLEDGLHAVVSIDRK